MCDRKPGELGEVSSDSSKAFKELNWKAEKSLLNMCKSKIDLCIEGFYLVLYLKMIEY